MPHQRPPALEYDVALLDLDGVVYTGQGAVRSAVPALARVREAGQRLAFVTNNASRSPSAVAAHLTRLGVPATDADVVTSAQAAATLIAERVPPGSPVLVVGAMGLRLALRARGLRPVSVAADQPLAVVQGYAPDMSYGLLAEGGLAVRAGALFVGANADRTLPSPHGTAAGQRLDAAGDCHCDRRHSRSSPESRSRRCTPRRLPATGAKRPLVVGDRLDTDIEGATRGGADSMLVLTGVSTARELVLAAPSQRPTYVSADLPRPARTQPAVGPELGEDPSRQGTKFAAAAGRLGRDDC